MNQAKILSKGSSIKRVGFSHKLVLKFQKAFRKKLPHEKNPLISDFVREQRQLQPAQFAQCRRASFTNCGLSLDLFPMFLDVHETHGYEKDLPTEVYACQKQENPNENPSHQRRLDWRFLRLPLQTQKNLSLREASRQYYTILDLLQKKQSVTIQLLDLQILKKFIDSLEDQILRWYKKKLSEIRFTFTVNISYNEKRYLVKLQKNKSSNSEWNNWTDFGLNPTALGDKRIIQYFLATQTIDSMINLLILAKKMKFLDDCVNKDQMRLHFFNILKDHDENGQLLSVMDETGLIFPDQQTKKEEIRQKRREKFKQPLKKREKKIYHLNIIHEQAHPEAENIFFASPQIASFPYILPLLRKSQSVMEETKVKIRYEELKQKQFNLVQTNFN